MNTSGSYSVYDIVALLPSWAQLRRRSPFTFGSDFISIPASGTVSQDIKISDDADFVLCYQSAVLTSDAGQATFVNNLPLMVTLTDGGSGRLTVNQPIHINNMFGIQGAASPVVLPAPQILARSSTYTITIANLTATANMSARLAFWGFKMYGDPLTPGTY